MGIFLACCGMMPSGVGGNYNFVNKLQNTAHDTYEATGQTCRAEMAGSRKFSLNMRELPTL